MPCPSTQIYHSQAFIGEVWAWTVLGILIFVARFAVRLRILPWRDLQGDDYMAIVTLVFFLGCIFCKLAIYYLGANSDYTEEEMLQLIDCQKSRLIIGSKFQILSWYTYASFLWSLKAMVLFFFHRLPLRPLQRRLHTTFTVLCGLTYAAVILTISCSCLPFHLNWATTPYPPPRCTDRTQNFYTTSISNAATDVAILTVALPLLWQLRVSVKRRVELTLLLCSGIFVTTAALTAMFMSLTNPDSTLNINIWGTREEIAGIAAVNAPILKPMFHRSFWKRDFDPSRRARAPLVRPRMVIERREGVADRPVIVETRRSAIAAIISRRLGILTSLQSLSSGPSTGGLNTGVMVPKSSIPKQEQSTVESQPVDEESFTSLEWAWGVPKAINALPAVPRGPRPLLPEPAHSWSSADTKHHLGGLPTVQEEDDITVVQEVIDADLNQHGANDFRSEARSSLHTKAEV